ncbi:MAG: response regulator transcription factor [Gammaproteobacteria bacterium]|jgi:two-component system response regulator RegA|nr:response regulator transcription factor [Gammaproteobacteria bacterium]
MKEKTLLLVDDDEIFCQVLARAFTNRGMQTSVANNASSALAYAESIKPEFAVVDLRMPDCSGLELIPQLLKIHPSMKVIVLTGYASISTAVEAIKLGAVHYLTKPTDADEIMSALTAESGNSAALVRDKPLSLDRLEWEHLQKVLGDCDGNISAAARQLGMHRRTLQRKLSKRPTKLH